MEGRRKAIGRSSPVLALFEKHSGDACPGILPLTVQSAGPLVNPRSFPVEPRLGGVLLLPCCFCCPAALLLLLLVTLLVLLPTNHPSQNAFNRRLPSPLPNLDLPSSLSSSFLLLDHNHLDLDPAHSRGPVRCCLVPITRPIREDDSAITHPAVRHAPHCTASTRPRCLCFDPAQNYDSSPAHVFPSHPTQLSSKSAQNPQISLERSILVPPYRTIVTVGRKGTEATTPLLSASDLHAALPCNRETYPLPICANQYPIPFTPCDPSLLAANGTTTLRSAACDRFLPRLNCAAPDLEPSVRHEAVDTRERSILLRP